MPADARMTTETLAEEWGHTPTLSELRESVNAWKAHVDRLSLDDRQRFAAWMIEQGPDLLAWLIDSEVGREEIYHVYLRDRYGETEEFERG